MMIKETDIKRRGFIAASMTFAIAGVALNPRRVMAETWPSQPIRFIVPYAPGAGLDPMSRILAKQLTQTWKSPIVVENKPGANGAIGAGIVAHSRPDGYTVLMSSTGEVTVNEYVMKDLGYSPEKDLRPLTRMVNQPFILVTGPSSQFKNMEELLDFARKNPRKVTYSSSGVGSPQQISMLILMQVAGVEMTHIPYNGVAQALPNLMAGIVDIGFVGFAAGAPLCASGKLRALGVSSPAASPKAPDIRPLASVKGLEKYESGIWFGSFLPAATPDAIASRMQADIVTALNSPEVKGVLEKQGYTVVADSSQDFQAFLERERKKVQSVVHLIAKN